jgi:hypothetical protein
MSIARAIIARRFIENSNAFSLTFVRNYAKPFNTLGRKSVDTVASETQTGDLPTKLPEKGEEVAPLSGVPDEYFTERRARIFTPAKNSMQSGTHSQRRWLIDFDTRERWQNSLMGWGSSYVVLNSLRKKCHLKLLFFINY